LGLKALQHTLLRQNTAPGRVERESRRNSTPACHYGLPEMHRNTLAQARTKRPAPGKIKGKPFRENTGIIGKPLQG
jgi:hypothetical protein